MWNMPQVETHGSLYSVCDLDRGLSEFCTRTLQKWPAITYSVSSGRIIESACAAVLCTLYLCMGDFPRGGGLVVLSEAVFSYLNKNTFNFI